MTKDGYDKILSEINYLETVKRPEISAQIAEARDKGDLSENAEYDAAKEAQGIMEAKLAQLKGLISNARLIDETRVQTDEVQILNKVKIKNTKNNAVMTYTLVSDSEANLKEGKIAVSTPIAQGLMGTEGPGAKLRGLRHPFGTSVCYTVMERGDSRGGAHSGGGGRGASAHHHPGLLYRPRADLCAGKGRRGGPGAAAGAGL